MKAYYLIPECNLPRFDEQISELNRRAKRLGVEPIVTRRKMAQTFAVIDGKRYLAGSLDCRDADGELFWPEVDTFTNGPQHQWICQESSWTGAVELTFLVEVSGQAPRYEGWELAAVLVPVALDDGAENQVNVVPGHEIPPSFRTRVGECDHCHTVRRRNETFVCMSLADGEYRLVGRQCLKDFLGHQNPHAIASWAQCLAEFEARMHDDDFWGDGGGRAPERYSLSAWVAQSIVVIRRHGWMSSSQAYQEDGQSTRDWVQGIMQPLPPGCPESARRQHERMVALMAPSEADKQLADEAIEWWAERDGDSDFDHNCRLTARAGYVNCGHRGNAGLATWLAAGYLRHLEQLRLKEAEQNRMVSGAIDPSLYPTVKPYRGKNFKIQITDVEVLSIHPFEADSYGGYGVDYCAWIRFLAPCGHVLSWRCGRWDDSLKVGEHYELIAVIDRIGDGPRTDEYKGFTSTRINRVELSDAVVA